MHIDATYEGRFDAAFAWRDHKRIRVGDNSRRHSDMSQPKARIDASRS
jgi:hypothetical protein